MLQETIEGKWVKSFADVFRLCAVKPGEVVAIVSEFAVAPDPYATFGIGIVPA